MAKGTYQTYTDETSIEDYRADYIHRGAMCAALSKRYPALAAIGTDADQILTQIDSRRIALQEAEDDQIRARAVEDAEKFDVVEVYTELRRTLFAKKVDVQTLLPDAPSVLGRLAAKKFRARADQALENLKTLPDTDPVKTAFLAVFTQELTEFHAADDAEDKTREGLASESVALTLYKTELSQAREAQLGAVLKVVGDSEKMAMFTLPWRSNRKKETPPAATPATPATPPAPAAPPSP